MKYIKTIKFTIFLLLSCTGNLYPNIRLPKLIGHGAILQRDEPVKIWGWSEIGEKITARINGETYSTVASPTGTWEVILPPFAAGGPYSLYLLGTTGTVEHEVAVHNIYFGDVWLCSGQSNMELPVRRVLDLYSAEVSATSNEYIRYFHVPSDFKFGQPETDLKQGEWKMLNPSTALQMSAVAYFFAKDIYARTQVPQGFIINAVGGSPAEAWLSEETIKNYPVHAAEYEKYRDPEYIETLRARETDHQKAWIRHLDSLDQGIREGWHKTFAQSDWRTTTLPNRWDESWFSGIKKTGDPVYGSVWFKRQIVLEKIPVEVPVRLDLGTIIDADDVYINGLPIGSTSYRYPPRIYTFSSSLLNSGENTLTVRIRAYGENGEFIQDKPYSLTLADTTIDLRANWHYKLGHRAATPLPVTTFLHYKPSSLYNALLYPLKNLAIKGVLWYQGESNTKNPEEYRHLFADVVSDWRILFGNPSMPFLYVQLANYMRDENSPGESNWAELRQVQLEALSIPHTGMATCIDLGEWNDIHPLNKKEVGRRLALVARKLVYGDDVIYSGPLYRRHRVEGNRMYIYFDHAENGLFTKDGAPLQHVALATEDGRYVWANAQIEKDHIVVWHDSIPNPKTVRYAWGHNPEKANLVNREGLPASPFTTTLD